MTNRRRILIVEDDEPTRERLVHALAAHPGELELAAAVGTCREALLALRRDPPEVLRVDLALADGNGHAGASRDDALPRDGALLGSEKRPPEPTGAPLTHAAAFMFTWGR